MDILVLIDFISINTPPSKKWQQGERKRQGLIASLWRAFKRSKLFANSSVIFCYLLPFLQKAICEVDRAVSLSPFDKWGNWCLMGKKQTQSKSQGQRQQTRQGPKQCCQHTGIAWGTFGKCLQFEIGSAASRVQSELRTTDPQRLGKRNSPTR